MTRSVVAPAVAGALLLCAPNAAVAQSFPNCTSDCRAAYDDAVRLCVGKTGDLLRACRARAEQTFSACSRRCVTAENARIRLQDARDREAAERRRLRGQPEPPRPQR